MKLLAIDTSTKFLSAAIAENENILISSRDDGSLRHSDLLIPTIDCLLKKCRLKLKDMDSIVLSIGPGSFTGLRIGVAACKAMNLALGIPIAAVPTLDVIAYNFVNEKRRMLCPLIDAKKNKVYASLYKTFGRARSNGTGGPRRLDRVADYMLADVDDLLKKIDRPTLVFGDGIDRYNNSLRKNPFVDISKKDWHPKAEVLAALGFYAAKKRKFTNADRLAPMYLHSQYCQVT